MTSAMSARGRKQSLFILAIALALTMAFADENNSHTLVPPSGYVPDEQTAIAIAVAVWKPIYGRDKIEAEKPYHAVLRGATWIVEGSLPCTAGNVCAGGTAIAEISSKDGRILRVSHGQ